MLINIFFFTSKTEATYGEPAKKIKLLITVRRSEFFLTNVLVFFQINATIKHLLNGDIVILNFSVL